MLTQNLASEENQIIKDVISKLINSHTTNYDKGHPILDELAELYHSIDIAFNQVEKIIQLENVKENPILFPELDLMDVIAAQFALMTLMPDIEGPAKANVVRYFELLINAKKGNELNLN